MPVKEFNKDNIQEIEESNIPVIIDFWASWCGPCRMMAPVFEELSNEKEYENKLTFAKISVEENQDLAQKYHVQGIPCLIIMKRGEEIDRIVGFAPKETLKTKIRDILSTL